MYLQQHNEQGLLTVHNTLPGCLCDYCLFFLWFLYPRIRCFVSGFCILEYVVSCWVSVSSITLLLVGFLNPRIPCSFLGFCILVYAVSCWGVSVSSYTLFLFGFLYPHIPCSLSGLCTLVYVVSCRVSVAYVHREIRPISQGKERNRHGTRRRRLGIRTESVRRYIMINYRWTPCGTWAVHSPGVYLCH